MNLAPMTVYIAEDEPLAREALLSMCAAAPRWRVLGAADNGRRALDECLARMPDLLLTDIRMPLLDGLELALALRASSTRLQVAFVTAFDQHAVAAFRLAAVDYLLKPVTDADFRACLARVEQRLLGEQAVARWGASLQALARERRDSLRHLIVRSVGRIDLVPIDDVLALRADGNYVDVITAARAWAHRETLKSLGERLDPARFVQVHRSVIIAIDQVRRLERGDASLRVVMSNDASFPVGANFVTALEQALGMREG